MNSRSNGKKGNRRLKGRRPRQRGNRVAVGFPPTHVCSMKYTSQVIGLTGASNHATQLYYINSPYHPEGTGTDTSNALSFTELATIYNTFHVQSFNAVLTIVNEEAFETLICMAPSTIALTLGSAALTTQLGELPFGRTTILSRNSGQNRARLGINCRNSRLSGNPMHYNADNQFFGGFASRPSTLQYLYFSVASLSGDNLTNGVTFSMVIEFKVKWNNRIFNDILGRQRLFVHNHHDEPMEIDLDSKATISKVSSTNLEDESVIDSL